MPLIPCDKFPADKGSFGIPEAGLSAVRLEGVCIHAALATPVIEEQVFIERKVIGVRDDGMLAFTTAH